MESFIINTGIALLISIVIAVLKIGMPEESYELRTSLILGIVAVINYTLSFLIILMIESWSIFWPLLYCLLFCYYLYRGAKTVAFKTTTGVFSQITNKLVGRMNAGTNWADPIFEIVTTNIDGVPNISIDLQELEMEILETPDMHTAIRGIKAKVRNVVFMLEVKENDISQLFEIEGGRSTIKHRILAYSNFFFLDEIGKINPVDLDEDKGNILGNLADKLKIGINYFCLKNNYPYEIPDDSRVTIGDTELDEEYYKVLSRKEYAKLEQDAKDIEAIKLRERISAFGEHNLPNGSKKEQTDYALIGLGIVKKDIQERKYAIDSELATLAKDIAYFFKK